MSVEDANVSLRLLIKNIKIPFLESDPVVQPVSLYAATKLENELMAHLYWNMYKLRSIGLRFFTVYGPRGRPDMAPFKFLKAISTGQTFDKYGTGETYRDYTYVSDIVNGIKSAIINKNKIKCEVYNLGNGNPIKLNKFIKICETVTGKEAVYNQLPDQPGDVPKTFADITKATKDLDYKPKVTFEEGLQYMYNWLKNE